MAIGTTGETSTLSHAKNDDMVMCTLELSAGRFPVRAGTGTNSTSETVSLTHRFNNSGLVGCLSVTPYYNRPSQEGLFQHFKPIAESSDLPQILYNVPARTGYDMPSPTVDCLAEIKNIIGIKEATGNLSRISHHSELGQCRFPSAKRRRRERIGFHATRRQRGISVTTNVAENEMARYFSLAADGNYAAVRRLNQRLVPLHQKLFFEPSPIPVKWVYKTLGLMAKDTLHLPMTPLTEEGSGVLRQPLINVGFL